MKFSLTKPWRNLPEAARQAILFGTGEQELDFAFVGERSRWEYRAPFEGLVPATSSAATARPPPTRRAREIERFMSMRPCPPAAGKRLRREALAVRVGGPHHPRAWCELSVKDALAWFRALALSAARAARSPPRSSRRSPTGSASWPRSGSTTSPSTAPPARSPAARRSASAWPPRSAPSSWACSTSSTSRRSACTSATTASCSTRSRGCATSATPCWSSSTTRRRCARPTGSSTSAPAPASTAARWSPQGRRRRSWRSRARSPAATSPASSPSRCPPAPPAGQRQATRRPRRPRAQPQGDRRGASRSAPSSASPASPARASRPSSTRSSTRPCARALYRALDRPGAHDRLEGVAVPRQGRRHRPVADRPHAALQPGHLHQGVRPDPRAVRPHPEARARGYKPGRFSFNVHGGRCEACAGDGQIKIEMHFLPDVYVTCEVCKGKRYGRETLEVRYKGLNIAEVLDLTVEQARELFSAHPKIARVLDTLIAVGLGYITLGQSATTLSGGEAQRIKLSRELARRATGHDALHPRRADHRPALRRHQEAARGAPHPRRPRQHRGRHRAPPRRHQDRRPGHRPRPRGRRRGRPHRRRTAPPSRSRRSRQATPAATSHRCSAQREPRRVDASPARGRLACHRERRPGRRRPGSDRLHQPTRLDPSPAARLTHPRTLHPWRHGA